MTSELVDVVPDNSTLDPYAVAKEVFGNPTNFAAALVILTQQPDLVRMFSRHINERRFGRHVRGLVTTFVAITTGEIDKEDVQATISRATAQHARRDVLASYQNVMRFVLDTLVCFPMRAHSPDPERPRFTPRQLEQYEQSTSLVGACFGVDERVSPDMTLSERWERLVVELNRMVEARDGTTGSAGANAFWGAVLEEETLQFLGMSASAHTVDALVQALREQLHAWPEIVEHYAAEGRRRKAALASP